MLPIFNPYLVIDQPCCSRTNLSSDRSPTQETLPSSLNSNLVVVNHSPTEFVLDFINKKGSSYKSVIDLLNRGNPDLKDIKSGDQLQLGKFQLLFTKV